MHAFASLLSDSDRIWCETFKFCPSLPAFLMQSHLYQLWKGGQRRSRVENQTEASAKPLQDLRSCPCAQRRQFLEPKDTSGAKKPPSGKNSSNLHSYRKLHVLASFNPSLQAFLIYNSSREAQILRSLSTSAS